MGPPIRRQGLLGLIAAITIGTLFCVAFHFDLFHIMQQQSSDLLFQAENLYEGRGSPENIIVVAIDDKSLGQLGYFPLWPRSHYVQLIDALAEAKARVIVFDVLFAEPSPSDDKLAMSIENAGNVILPFIQTSTVINPSVLQQTGQFKSFVRPLGILEDEAVAIGHASITPDVDGVVRRLPITIHDGDNYEPALALAAVAEYLRRPGAIESPVEDKVLPFAGRFIPISGNNEMLINYVANPQGSGRIVNFQTVSLVDILNGDANPALFQEKIVFIGATATGLADTFWTPVGRMMDGVEIHASAANTILTNNFLKTLPSIVTVTSILALALLTGLLVLRLRVLWASLSALFLCVVYALTAFSLFDNGIVLNMLYPPLAIAGAFVGVNLHSIVYERAEKGEITRTFGRYISPSVVDEILNALRKGGLKLGGKEHDVTIAFADIRGFTSISEKINPEELVRALNIYLSIIIKTVLKYDGIINKFGGDSVMAIWNVPTQCEGHALLAIKAAVSAQSAIRELQAEKTTLPKMEFGIGINTGKAVAGNLGSEDRLEYSVIGDAVNTAARLATAAPGGNVWIGVDTFMKVKNYIITKALKPLLLKGKQEPVQAYEVVDIQSQDASNLSVIQ
ncbi:CHASE2 domain-containing protein [Chloroflexota bacterium]